jgi:signal transduction histidine kinase
LRLLYKLLALLLFAALVPVSVAGTSSVRLSDAELRARVREVHEKTAAHLAERVAAFVESVAWDARGAFAREDLARMRFSEQAAVLNASWRQSPEAEVLVVFDAMRNQVGPAMYHDGRDADRGDREGVAHAQGEDTRSDDRRSVSDAEFHAFLAGVDFTSPWGARGWAAGTPTRRAGAATASLPLYVGVPGADARPLHLVALLVSLERACEWFAEAQVGERGTAVLADARGVTLCGDTGDVAALLDAAGPGRARYGARLASAATVPALGWTVAAGQPRDEALAVVHEIRRRTLGLAAGTLVVVVLLALAWVRLITLPVRRLVAGALEYARGNFGHAVPVTSRDELGHLTRTFNHMGRELESSHSLIAQQKSEIETWNRELQARVEEKTRELRALQDQLLQSQKMAAVGQLGAGFAHEINNPLANIRGAAQLLSSGMLDAQKQRRYLARIDENVETIRCVVDELLRLARADEGGTRGPVDLNALVRERAPALATRLAARNIEVQVALCEALPPIHGDLEALHKVLSNLVDNAETAMPSGGRLTLGTDVKEGAVVGLWVRDTGMGISPEHQKRIFEPFFTTKENWRGKGLGLTSAYAIVTAHSGRIDVESAPGHGATFTLTFPGIAGGAQLA